jgi:hypothetical protein
MSSKRKSPPTKLHEGNTLATDYSAKSGSTSPPPRENGTGSSSEPADEVQDFDESSNLSGEDDDVGHLAPSSYGDEATAGAMGGAKYSDDSEEGGYQDDEELEDIEDLDDMDEIDDDEVQDEQHRSPPNKKQRLLQDSSRQDSTSSTTLSLVPSLVPALSAIHLQREMQQQHDEMSHKSLNNNSSSLNHNSLLASAPKRTMDDVLKRLTSKMNHSTIKEERPAPSTTPTSKQSR